MPEYLKSLAIDLGASSGRVLLGKFDGNRIKLEELKRFVNAPVRVRGTLYWDILRLFGDIKHGFEEAKKSGHTDIASIGIDTWGNDFGLLDKKGKLLGNPIHYRDDRTIGMMEKVFERVSRWDVFQHTGIQFMRLNGFYQLFSMVYNKEPELEIAEKLLTIPDLLVYFLTGETVGEFTNVTTTQMFNPMTADWDRELMCTLEIPEKIFPPIVRPGTILSNLSEDILNEFPFRRAKVISVAQHDTASAVAAVPAEEEDFVYISSGTWALMGVEVTKPIINEKTFRHNFSNEGGVFDTYRLLKNVMGLWIIQECKRAWSLEGEEYSFAELEKLGYAAKPFKCFIDPDEERFVSPGDMPAKIIAYCRETGQDEPENKGEIVRCVMESLALKFRYVLEMIEQITSKKYRAIHILGGGVKDRMMCQFTADSTNKKVIAGPIEATAVGNILMQLTALGEINSIAEARQVVRNSFHTEEYSPKNNNDWNQAYDRFVKFIQR